MLANKPVSQAPLPLPAAGGLLAAMRLALALLALLGLRARAQGQIVASYVCSLAEVAACAVERDACIASPRLWRRGYDADFVCSCWAQSYLCYADCNSRFPIDFQPSCLAVCPPVVCTPALGWAHP